MLRKSYIIFGEEEEVLSNIDRKRLLFLPIIVFIDM